jgi:hypothetical protein
MDEAEKKHNTAPTPVADNPFEMGQEEVTRMIGWFLHLRRRILYHKRSLELGADPRDVDIASDIELRMFAAHDRVLGKLGLPSGKFTRALSDVQSNAVPDYFKPRRGKKGRPPLAARQHLRGNAAHLVEVMVAGKEFSVAAAAKRVADAFNAAGFPPPKQGAVFTRRAVEDWHAFVVHKAKAADPARDLFTKQQTMLQRTHPSYRQWGPERLKEWLSHSVRDMACLGYFGATKPG